VRLEKRGMPQCQTAGPDERQADLNWKLWMCNTSCKLVGETLQVSWSLTSPFSRNMAISQKKGQEWKVIHTQWRKA